MNNEVDGQYPSAPPTLLNHRMSLFSLWYIELESTPAPPSPDKKPNPKAKASPKKTTHKKTSVKQSVVGEASTQGPIKASHPMVTLELLEIALDSVTAEHRCQVANSHGITPNLLHMVSCSQQRLVRCNDSVQTLREDRIDHRVGRTSRSKTPSMQSILS
jgi:hypothetical protein